MLSILGPPSQSIQKVWARCILFLRDVFCLRTKLRNTVTQSLGTRGYWPWTLADPPCFSCHRRVKCAVRVCCWRVPSNETPRIVCEHMSYETQQSTYRVKIRRFLFRFVFCVKDAPIPMLYAVSFACCSITPYDRLIYHIPCSTVQYEMLHEFPNGDLVMECPFVKKK